MAGKYAGVAKRFPKADPKDLAFQEKVEAAKSPRGADHGNQVRAELLALYEAVRGLNTADDGTPASVATLYAQLRDVKDLVDAFLGSLNVRIAAAEQRMWDGFEDAGLEKVGLAGGGSVSVNPDVTIQVTDRDALNRWARRNKLGPRMTLYHPVVESIMREKILAGEELPSFIKVGSIKKTTYRR